VAPVQALPAQLPRLEYTVVPAELLDAGVLDRIPHRVRVRRFGTAWLSENIDDGKRAARSGGDSDSIYPVIGETKTKIRIVFEDDHARLAMWIARTDAWHVIATPIQLADRDGKLATDSGVWVVRGAPAHLGARIAGRREVHLRDDDVALAGFVPETVLSNVWLADKSDPKISFKQPSYESWEPVADGRARLKLAVDSKLRATAAADAPVIATVTSDSVIGYLVASSGDDRLIEIPRPYARVRGHVNARDATPTEDLFSMHGSGTGHGFGMSHADRIDVPPGTCLFDRIEGDVVGVQSELSTRYGSRHPYNVRTGAAEPPKWSQVYVGTSWTTVSVYIRDTSDDPKDPVWESCTEPVHR
jgi:hypothetical protein